MADKIINSLMGEGIISAIEGPYALAALIAGMILPESLQGIQKEDLTNIVDLGKDALAKLRGGTDEEKQQARDLEEQIIFISSDIQQRRGGFENIDDIKLIPDSNQAPGPAAGYPDNDSKVDTPSVGDPTNTGDTDRDRAIRELIEAGRAIAERTDSDDIPQYIEQLIDRSEERIRERDELKRMEQERDDGDNSPGIIQGIENANKRIEELNRQVREPYNKLRRIGGIGAGIIGGIAGLGRVLGLGDDDILPLPDGGGGDEEKKDNDKPNKPKKPDNNLKPIGAVEPILRPEFMIAGTEDTEELRILSEEEKFQQFLESQNFDEGDVSPGENPLIAGNLFNQELLLNNSNINNYADYFIEELNFIDRKLPKGYQTSYLGQTTSKELQNVKFNYSEPKHLTGSEIGLEVEPDNAQVEFYDLFGGMDKPFFIDTNPQNNQELQKNLLIESVN